jgi:hypothetical protein
MNLPEDIEKQLVEYLRLEYGEDANGPDAIQISDIAYVGEKEVNGVVLHCWSYPCLKDNMWATVELLENNSYCLGMCEIPRETEECVYKYLYLVIEAKKTRKVKIPYVGHEDYEVLSFEKTYEVDLENGKKLSIFSEVYQSPKTKQFSLSIEYDGKEIYLKGGIGLQMNYAIEGDIRLFMEIGELKWDA